LFREEKRVKKRKKVVKSKLSFAAEDDDADEAGKDEDVEGVLSLFGTGLGTDLLMDNYRTTH